MSRPPEGNAEEKNNNGTPGKSVNFKSGLDTGFWILTTGFLQTVGFASAQSKAN